MGRNRSRIRNRENIGRQGRFLGVSFAKSHGVYTRSIILESRKNGTVSITAIRERVREAFVHRRDSEYDIYLAAGLLSSLGLWEVKSEFPEELKPLSV